MGSGGISLPLFLLFLISKKNKLCGHGQRARGRAPHSSQAVPASAGGASHSLKGSGNAFSFHVLPPPARASQGCVRHPPPGSSSTQVACDHASAGIACKRWPGPRQHRDVSSMPHQGGYNGMNIMIVRALRLGIYAESVPCGGLLSNM